MPAPTTIVRPFAPHLTPTVVNAILAKQVSELTPKEAKMLLDAAARVGKSSVHNTAFGTILNP